MLKVLIVDDSPTASRSLRLALESDPRLLVVGEAASGEEALALCQRFDPDLVTMDVHLTEESGFDVTREIMARMPRPILIVTGLAASLPDLACQAMAHGALDVFPKLPAPGSPDYEGQRQRLTRLVHSLAAVPILHRSRPGPAVSGPVAPPASSRSRHWKKVPVDAAPPELLLIGASTGGPQVIAALLERLPSSWRAPVVVAQHITVGFAAGFARWLGQVLRRDVVLVEEPLRLNPARIYVAPDDADLVFVARGEVTPEESPPDSRIQPSIDALFTSAARCVGSGTFAMLLTGMGRDGATGMAALAAAGAVTVIQALETCTVDSMPRSAIGLSAAHLILSPDEMAEFLEARAAAPAAGC